MFKTLTLHTHGGQHAPPEGVYACVHEQPDGHVGVCVSCPHHGGVCVHVSEHGHGCAHAPQREHAWHRAAYQRDMRNENHLHLNEADLVRVFLDVLVIVVDVMLMVVVVMEHLGWHRGAIPSLFCPV